jgi:hypothetical protein
MRIFKSEKTAKPTNVSTGPIADPAGNVGFNGNIVLILVAALTVLGFFGFNAVSSPIDLAANIFIDDSFMYFETAWQTATNGFVTFDSMNPTNGVQFLWFAILVAAAKIAPIKITLLYIAYGVNLAIVVGVYAAIWRCGTLFEDRRRILTMLMTVLVTAVLVDRQHLMFSGMESTAHMGALWFCLVAGATALIRCDRSARFPAKSFLLFTIGTVFVTWARIDSALFSLTLYCYVCFNLFLLSNNNQEEKMKYLLFSLLIVVIGALIQVSFYYFSGDTILPISGLVKATGIGPEITADVWARVMSVVFPFAKLFDETNPVLLVAQAVAFSALLWAVLQRAFRARSSLRFLYGFAGSLGVAIPIYAVIIGPSHHPEWRWYLAAVYLFYSIGLAALLYEGCGKFLDGFRRKRSVAVLSGISIALMFLFVLFYSHRAIPHFLTRAQVAQFGKESTDRNDILAAFNAGQLAFLAERRTINLDGLVNSKDYLDNNLNNPDSLINYLRENNVRYVVDYDFYWAHEAIINNSVLKYSFKIRNDREQRTLFIRELTGPLPKL